MRSVVVARTYEPKTQRDLAPHQQRRSGQPRQCGGRDRSLREGAFHGMSKGGGRIRESRIPEWYLRERRDAVAHRFRNELTSCKSEPFGRARTPEDIPNVVPILVSAQNTGLLAE